MTFSIVGWCPRTGQLGVGAVTAMVGVGKLVSHAAAGGAAVASQAHLNPYLAIDTLRAVAGGSTVTDAVDEALAGDPGRAYRQVLAIGADGTTAAWTGEECADWAGHRVGAGCVTAGNRLVGPETLTATLGAFAARPDDDLVDRLLDALAAGQATGADREGALSAHLLVADTEEYPLWDVRVDHSEDPVDRLAEVKAEFGATLVPAIRRLPTRDDPTGAAVRALLAGREGEADPCV